MARWKAIESPLGEIFVVADAAGLRWLTFLESRSPDEEAARATRYLGMEVERSRFPGDENATLGMIQTELAAYFEGGLKVFATHVAPIGPEFHMLVWQALLRIPFGQTKSYGQIAKEIGHPDASRAVGAANGANPISIVVPCHRVIGADGSLTGYGGGLWRKQSLLELEGALTPSLMS